MIAYIDSDIVGYRCAASCKEGDPFDVCIQRIDNLFRQILERTGAETYRSFLSGSRNWRKDFYPAYKANRKSIPPVFLQDAKEYIIESWSGEVSDGIEADDDIAIAHTETPGIICTIDKDFQQLTGSFYNFVTDTSFHIDAITATRFFYKQMLLGDKSDNVPGFDGMARVKPTIKIKEMWDSIDWLETERLMYEEVYEAFENGGGDFHLTGQLLYLWRKDPDEWQPNIGAN